MTAEIKYGLIQFSRSWQSIFFALVMPILFLALAWYMFGNASLPVLYYSDADGSQASQALLASLNSTGAVDLRDGAGSDLARMLRDGRISAYIVIPPGFGHAVSTASSGGQSGAAIEAYYDKSGAESLAIVSVVRQAIDQLNAKEAGLNGPAVCTPLEVPAAGAGYADFLIPGVLGIAIMGSALDRTVGTIVRYRATGVFRKLATTPLSRVEWNLARAVSGTLIVLLSVTISLAVAWMAFGSVPHIDAIVVLLVIAGSVLFVGLGSLIAYVIKGEAANAASFGITLPLMLLSGSLFPVEQLPWFLQLIASLSPLTYLNNGLRCAMISGNSGDALQSLIVVGVAAMAFFVLGVALQKWKED